MDPDENRMRKAAHLMVSSLAGSFSLVSCRENLRESLTLNLKMALQVRSLRQKKRGSSLMYLMIFLCLLFQQPPNMSVDAYEGVVNLLVQDNLEMCCNLCERSTAEKALRDVDKLLRGVRGKAQRVQHVLHH
jgi:CCR4-NOT transcription complex subunit 1